MSPEFENRAIGELPIVNFQAATRIGQQGNIGVKLLNMYLLQPNLL